MRLCVLILVGGLAADRWGIRGVMAAYDPMTAAVMATLAVGVLLATGELALTSGIDAVAFVAVGGWSSDGVTIEVAA